MVDPNLHKDINKIEKIQRYVAKFVENDYLSNSSVTDLINDLARVCNKEEPLIKVQNCTQTYLYSQPTLPHPKQL